MIAADPPLAPPSIIVQSPKDGSAQILLGIVAFGDQDAISRMEAAAAAAGLRSGRPSTTDGQIELMVMFNSTTSPRVAFDFASRANRGDFGALKIETMLMPSGAMKKK